MKMFRFSRFVWITCSGLLWIGIGVWLLMLGIHFIVEKALIGKGSSLLIDYCSSLANGRESGTFLIVVLALFIGFFKGRYILSKTVRRVVMRIVSLEEPIPIQSVYSIKYIAVIAGMMGLGMSMKWLCIPLDIRGFVDVAVGSALINGASFYFRALFALKRTK